MDMSFYAVVGILLLNDLRFSTKQEIKKGLSPLSHTATVKKVVPYLLVDSCQSQLLANTIGSWSS
jgi:hypothetical protein